MLLDALPAIDAELDVIGGGPGRGELEARAQRLGVAERVRFHGPLPRREDVLEAMQRASVQVMPSRALPDGQAEGSPVVTKEAQAVGIPLVATDTGGIAETVPPAHRGRPRAGRRPARAGGGGHAPARRSRGARRSGRGARAPGSRSSSTPRGSRAARSRSTSGSRADRARSGRGRRAPRGGRAPRAPRRRPARARPSPCRRARAGGRRAARRPGPGSATSTCHSSARGRAAQRRRRGAQHHARPDQPRQEPGDRPSSTATARPAARPASPSATVANSQPATLAIAAPVSSSDGISARHRPTLSTADPDRDDRDDAGPVARREQPAGHAAVAVEHDREHEDRQGGGALVEARAEDGEHRRGARRQPRPPRGAAAASGSACSAGARAPSRRARRGGRAPSGSGSRGG